jgi:hypothetical protein
VTREDGVGDSPTFPVSYGSWERSADIETLLNLRTMVCTYHTYLILIQGHDTKSKRAILLLEQLPLQPQPKRVLRVGTERWSRWRTHRRSQRRLSCRSGRPDTLEMTHQIAREEVGGPLRLDLPDHIL